MLMAQNVFTNLHLEIEASVVKFDVLCQKWWSEIDNMFPFMHEHRPGEDQLYLAVQFNSKVISCYGERQRV